MAIYKDVTVAHLQGDLTHSGVTHNIVTSLAVSLHKMSSGSEKTFHIDCGEVHTADINGLQLLYVWMQCARINGVEPVLVNLSRSLRQAMKRMGLTHCFSDTQTA